MTRRAITVAAYQAPLLASGSMDVIGLVAEQVRACESTGVDVLCCPEALVGGLADYSSTPHALAIDVASGQLRDALMPLASATVTTIVGFTEAGPHHQLFNAAAVFSRGDVIGVYRKMHPAINRSIYEPGTETPVFTVRDVVFGVAICRDSTFPDLVQRIAARGATVLFVPTNNALPPAKGGMDVVSDARRTDMKRASENGLPVVRADVAGRIDGLESYGSSAITDADGSVLQSARPLEVGLLVDEIR